MKYNLDEISNKTSIKKFATTEFYLFLIVIAIMIILKIFAADFYSINNIMGTFNYFSYLLIGAIGMNLIIITGNIDVSAGPIISVVCVVMGLLGKANMPFIVFMPVGMAVGAALSYINGIFITKLKIPSIVATLATTQLFAGILPLVIKESLYEMPESFTWLAFNAKLFGIPSSTIVMIIIVVLSILFMKYSRFAKKIYAIGNNAKAAKLAGINVNKTVVLSFVIAGALYGVSAAFIATAGQRVTTTMGSGLEMTFIAAVVLGGTSIAGGSGKIIGTVLGTFILALISPAMNYIGLSSDWSDAVMGAIILASVIVAQIAVLTEKDRLSIMKLTNDAEVK
jgi:ribose/xylose/arabinose/galactoside ABC-type transport system permease subunit